MDPIVADRLFNRQGKKGDSASKAALAMENRINIIKVKDARKALRRRYASRTNLDKIFT